MNDKNLNITEFQKQLFDALRKIQELEERLRQVEKTLVCVENDSPLVRLVRQAI